jgi:hypothetical protein
MNGSFDRLFFEHLRQNCAPIHQQQPGKAKNIAFIGGQRSVLEGLSGLKLPRSSGTGVAVQDTMYKPNDQLKPQLQQRRQSELLSAFPKSYTS